MTMMTNRTTSRRSLETPTNSAKDLMATSSRPIRPIRGSPRVRCSIARVLAELRATRLRLRKRTPDFPPRAREKYGNTTGRAGPQSRSNPVSGRCLPKTGIFQISAGDYRLIRAGSGQIRSLETGRQFAKARHWRAFLAFPVVKSLWAGLPGWRRSAVRTRLQV
jgi:hypothetical protein